MKISHEPVKLGKLFRLPRTCLVHVALVLCLLGIAPPARAESKDFATFFTGHLVATGNFKNFRDGSTRGIRTDIRGGPVGKGFRLTTNTTFSDGQKERKVWSFQKVATDRYVGRRADLIGTATVVVRGHTVRLNYTARVRGKDGKSYNVAFMETFRFANSGAGTSMVKASVFSIPVGEAQFVVRKLSR